MQLPENQIEYTDRLSVTETFVNSMGKCFFSEGVANIVLCVTRLDRPEPCRLVLTPQAVIQLFQGLNAIMGAMQKEGIIKTHPKPNPKETQH